MILEKTFMMKTGKPFYTVNEEVDWIEIDSETGIVKGIPRIITLEKFSYTKSNRCRRSIC